MVMAHRIRYFALVFRDPDGGALPLARASDIYDTQAKCKWEWLEYQAMRYRAALGLDTTLQVSELFPTGNSDGAFVDEIGIEVLITDQEEEA